MYGEMGMTSWLEKSEAEQRNFGEVNPAREPRPVI
jgi:hypothetical protein